MQFFWNTLVRAEIQLQQIISNLDSNDSRWVSGVDEFELQHLLTKKYINPNNIIDYMCERKEPPKVLTHLVGNRSGIFLMELRKKFATGNSNSELNFIVENCFFYRTLIF